MLSRVSLRAALGVAFASLVASTLSMSAANADRPTAVELQTKLIQTRQQINALYMQAAAANERVNGATYELGLAEAAMKKHRAVLKRVDQEYRSQREVVAEMTVEQQLNGSTSQAMMSLLDGGQPATILQEATSLKAVDEAMTAELDRLDASKTVVDSASSAVEKVVKDRRHAVSERKTARAQINAAISQAEALEQQLAGERSGIVQQLARLQDKPVAQVERELQQIEEQVDASGPGVPVVPTPEPSPGVDPSDPRPTPPAPTTPKPTPTPTQPTPDPDPGPAPSSKVEKAIAFAEAQLGEPYAWGGAGPSKWDCSGLTMRAWEAAGVSLSHYAPTQFKQTTKVSVSKIRRGDLLYWSNGSVNSIYHVALYLGNGKMIHAPRPGRSVEIVPLSYWIQPDMASRAG